MNKKLSRLIQPGMRLYFIVIVLFAVAAAAVDFYLAGAYLAVGLILYVYSKIMIHRQRVALADYVAEISYSVETAQNDNMTNMPMPVVIFRLDNEEVIWSNKRFSEMTGTGEKLFEVRISDIVPGFDTKWLMEGQTQCPELMTVGERTYQVFGNIVRVETDTKEYRFLGNIYWMDVTEYAEIDATYWNTRPVCALIVLDNYGDLLGNLTEKEKSAILANVDDEISKWCKASTGFLLRFDRDRYVYIIEEQDLEAYIAGKFSLLDRVREISSSAGIPATISIGIGKGGSFFENYEYAKLGIEMALARGGDQVVLKDQHNFEFYGGKGAAQERRTKVRSRVTAGSLEKLMRNAPQIYVMAHIYADYDSLGAACGVCCMARKLGREAKIILNPDHHAVGPMLERLRLVPEYENVFIRPQEALQTADENGVLIVVDTNRPDQVEVPALLEMMKDIVVIDHHRRAGDYIQDATINFHEPYASSACELMTELLQYIVEPKNILHLEAEALLAGIAMDTKNFTLRTGSRTFEAAAFLRRAGANTTDVKRMMQSDFDGTVARYDVVRQAELYRDGIVIAAPERTIDRVIGAIAADELLNIAGVRASFVLYPVPDGVIISARSIGDVNVQFILEKLGGGGNRNTAGAQVKERSHREVVELLKAALDAYCEDETANAEMANSQKEGA